MRATWDREDFELAARGNLDFTPKQAELIRSEVVDDGLHPLLPPDCLRGTGHTSDAGFS